MKPIKCVIRVKLQDTRTVRLEVISTASKEALTTVELSKQEVLYLVSELTKLQGMMD